ncbi:MAG: trehalose-6-phosphate synthase [Ilumatobacteraceae bacterium]
MDDDGVQADGHDRGDEVEPVGDEVELVIVANRLPVTWSNRNGWVRAPGGLVTALDGIAQRRALTWVGHASPNGPPGLPAPWRHGRLRSIDIEPTVSREAIDGLANSALWPALHGLGAHVRWRSGWWDSYVEYNRQVAATLTASLPADSLVWVHDHQLMLLPALLRDVDPQRRVGVSIHTPFDLAGVEALPAAEDLATGLAAANCIGAQTDADRDAVAAFIRSAAAEEPTGAQVFTSPTSIDAPSMRALLDDPITIALAERERRATAGRTLILTVDRLDYTKGILERMQAYDLAFRKGWITPDEVRIVQVTRPTRSALPDYRELRIATERLAHELTTRWVRADGSSPFESIIESIDRRRVAALLSLADVFLVTPARDGMNLVAKEFSILNEPHGGSLVLSRGAGASHALATGSIIVDDVQPASIAMALHRATQVPPWDRMRLARKRADAVRAWTSVDWAEAFVERLVENARPEPPVEPSPARVSPVPTGLA